MDANDKIGDSDDGEDINVRHKAAMLELKAAVTAFLAGTQ